DLSFSLDGMLCKHHFSKKRQVFFHIFWVVTLIMQSRCAQGNCIKLVAYRHAGTPAKAFLLPFFALL
ncbi:hypothetical protein QBC90_15120, partial [Lacticaseibacillus paracasei subsp. paracasei]|nr:hypothetical protein [Lacticaseibacillus paracasei subsp. paracasei]